MSLIPPRSFGLVEENLYRSSAPSEVSFPFLETLDLKAVLFLGAHEPSRQLYAQQKNKMALSPHPPSRVVPHPDHVLSFLRSLLWAADQNIELIRLRAQSSEVGPLMPMSEETLIEGLRFLLDGKNYPILVTCKFGSIFTGTLIGCLRKLQRWNLSCIFEEYRRFAATIPSKNPQQNEQFIELFDTDLVSIPEHAPAVLRFS